MLKWFSALLGLGLLLGGAGCGAPPAASAPTTLSVFAAASLTEAFTEIGKEFEAAHPGVSVAFNFAGSQQLAQQLTQGAPADVFASANTRHLDAVIEAGRVMPGAVSPFVRNRLVVIYPQDNPAGLRTLNDLARPGLRLVLAAREVPAGQYAIEFLDRSGQAAAFGTSFRDAALHNIVSYEENVKAVLSKVVLGEADAGIVYVSDISLGNASKVGRIDIPDALNAIATYPIAPVSDSAHPTLAQTFIDWVLGAKGQAALARHGFIPVSP